MGIKLPDGTLQDRCLERVRVGEPFFVLRAQDMTAPEFVELWLMKNTGAGGKLGDEHTQEANDRLNDMRQWQADNPDLVKMPD
jgi:hypothetical protein